MKKRIFITLILCIIACFIFAFSVNASEYPLVDDLGDPTWYTGNYELITDKESQVVLSNGDGTYTAYPAYYVLKYSITVSNGAVKEAYVNGFDYSFVNEKTGKNYDLGAIYSIELPNGLTTIVSGMFGHKPKEPNVTEIIMPDSMTSVGSHALREIKNLKRIVLSPNLTKIGAYAFYKCTGLEEFVLPAGSDAELNVSEENIFCGCTSLKEADLSTRNIKTLGSSFLSECTSLGKVTLPDSLESIGYCSLYKCPNLYLASDFLPSSLKSVGFQFLSGCTKSNSVLYFPEGFESFEATYCLATERYATPDTTLVFLGEMSGIINLEQFHASSGRKLTLVFTQNEFSDLNGKIVQADKNGAFAYIGKTADTSDTDYWTQQGILTINLGNASESGSKYKVDENGNTLYYINNNSYVIYFCGGEEVEVCYGVRSNVVNSEWGKHFTTPFTFDKDAHMSAGKHFDLTEVKSEVNCGYDGVTLCTCVVCKRVDEARVPATNDHSLIDVSPCADKCTVCLRYIDKAVQSHVNVEYFSYENGFTCFGAYGSKCTNEGCSSKSTREMEAMIEDLGFSVPEGGAYKGINYGFKINGDMICEYERVNGCEIQLGVLVAAGKNFALDTKIFAHTFKEYFSMIDVVLSFGNSNEHVDDEIVLAGFVLETKDTQKQTFFQAETDKKTTDYTSPTYGTLYGLSYNNAK